MKKFVFSLTALLLGILSSQAITFKGHLLFTSKLDGGQVVPSVSSNANGVASFMLNKNRDSININLSLIGLSGPVVNISLYQGDEGVNGTPLIDLTPFVNGNKLVTSLTGANLTANIPKFLNGNLYLLVTTGANPNGEIRGQIKLEADWNFVGDLSGMEVVPMVMGNAFGLGSFGLSLDKQKLSFKIVCQKLSGPITSAKLHFGDYGMVGNLAVDLTSYVTGINNNIVTGSVVPTSQMLDSLFNGKIYLNISTASNPSGEVRSQLINYKGLSFDANPTGSQMVPAVNSLAQGVCVLRLSTNLDTLFFDAVVDSLSSSLDYAHLHIGVANSPFGAVQLDFSSSISGHRVKGMKTGVATGFTIYRLLTSNLSFIFHTASFPSGEIRGQIIRYAREGYHFNMTGNQVVAPVTSPAFGGGFVSINRTEDNAHYAWNAGNLSAPATGAHFHKNKKGFNGVQIYDFTSSMTTSGTDVSASGFWRSSDATPFLAINSMQFNKDSIYLDIHNSVFPNGELRGQIISAGISTYVATTSIGPEKETEVTISVRPNPTENSISISSQYKKIESVVVMNAPGQVIYQADFGKTAPETITTIDFSNYPKGIYYVLIRGNDFSLSKKVIKE